MMIHAGLFYVRKITPCPTTHYLLPTTYFALRRELRYFIDQPPRVSAALIIGPSLFTE